MLSLWFTLWHTGPEAKPLILPLFSLSAHADVQEWAYIKFSWDKTEKTPFFTGTPPHLILMSDLEQFKYKKE